MPFIITDIDQELARNAVLRLDSSTQDLLVAGPVTIPGKSAGEIPFQFPPRISSDGKDNDWFVAYHKFAWEPIKFWQGSSARKISIKAVYVITNAKSNDVLWDAENVAAVTRAYKQYFYGLPKNDLFPAFEIDIYDQVPASGRLSKWRATSVSINPGDEIIRFNGSIFPLRTEVDITLEHATKIQKDETPALGVGNFPALPEQAWY